MFFIAEFNYIIVFAISVSVAVFSIAWLLMDRNNEKLTKTEETASGSFKASVKECVRSYTSRVKRSEAITNALNKAAPQLSKALTPKNEVETNKLKQRLKEAGFRSEGAFAMFLSLKLIFAVALLIIGGGIGLFLNGLLPELRSKLFSVAVLDSIFLKSD